MLLLDKDNIPNTFNNSIRFMTSEHNDIEIYLHKKDSTIGYPNYPYPELGEFTDTYNVNGEDYEIRYFDCWYPIL